jgi:hypothetical protein
LYDPVSGMWTATGLMSTSRYYHTATLLPNGNVLVAGGYNGNYLSSAELYNPTNGMWTATGSLNNPRYLHTATLLPNGKVLVVGGQGMSSLPYLSSAELYDPISGTWTNTRPLSTARIYHTATLLPNGNVLAAAGYGSSGSALLSAELYDVGLGFSALWQPQIITFTSPLSLGNNLALTGSQFRGISEGSGGNCGQDSPADYPMVQLRSLENEQTLFLLSTNWSTNMYTSASVKGLPPGFALVTMFVNGIPSTSGILDIMPAILPVLPFQITSIVRTNGTDLLITWKTSGTNNIVPVTPGTGASGSYATNGFTDVTNFVVTTAMTNFWDVGAATNMPSRYYRIRSPQ